MERLKGLVTGTVGFATEVRAEVLKITWPAKDELRKATLVILGFVALVSVLIGVLDIILQFLLVTLPGR